MCEVAPLPEPDDTVTDSTIDDLPVMEWELVERRIRLPEDLRDALQLPVSALRWSAAKHAKVLREHHADRAVILDLEQSLSMWKAAGPQIGCDDTWLVLLVYRDRQYIVVIGCDRSGSHNVVTVFGTTDSGYVQRRMSQPGIVRRD